MAVIDSYLSHDDYGYDFVVATTQESINSFLKRYLDNLGKDPENLCYLLKDGTLSEINLEDLKDKTGVDPFDIPDGTNYSDDRITNLTNHGFSVGLKIKIGLPPGITGQDLKDLVVMKLKPEEKVTLYLYVSEFQIVQNNPEERTWKVLEQPEDKPWFFETKVQLILEDLDNNLNTPYFNNNPDKKTTLSNHLTKLMKQMNRNSGEFRLKQLLFNIDDAEVLSIPEIEDVPNDSPVHTVLNEYFVDKYFAFLKTYGEPVLSVCTLSNNSGESSLVPTAIKLRVHQNSNNEKLWTLDYLCAVNNKTLPEGEDFTWDWMKNADLGNASGVLAVNRNTLVKYYTDILKNSVKGACIKVWCKVKIKNVFFVEVSYTLTPGQVPENEDTFYPYPKNHDKILLLKYKSDSKKK